MSHRSEQCLNCGAPTPDKFCSTCGQRNADYRESMREIIGEVAEEVLQFDSRIANTVVPFLIRPGQLTKDFIEGRRARYSSPFRLFLFMSALYFVAGWLAPRQGRILQINTHGVTISTDLPSPDAGLREEEKPFIEIGDGGTTLEPGDGGFFATYANERVQHWSQESKGKAEERLADWVVAGIPRAVFVLLPVFASLLALFFRKPKRFYFEHLVFALHYHSFLFLLLAIGHIAHVLFVGCIAAAVLYLGASLRRVYAPTWWQLAWKLSLLTLLYTLIVALSLAVLGFAAFALA